MEEEDREKLIRAVMRYDDMQRVADEVGNHNLARMYRHTRDKAAMSAYDEPFCYHDGINENRKICECGARKDKR